MVTILNRFAWMISLALGFLVSGTLLGFIFWYGGFGWSFYVSIILAVIIRKLFLSRSFIEKNIWVWDSISPQVHRPEESYISIIHDERKVQATSVESENMQEDIPYSPIYDTRDTPVMVEPDISIPEEPAKPNWIVVFFSDRPLAKIGWILLFLGALFFLSLVWNAVWPMAKIMIGLLFGFSLYGIGVWMDTKWHLVESRTLFGIGIAINMLTILSGRWIIWGNDGTLSDTITTVFLILNTLFAVITALIYSSRTFLIFSFAFSYIIPFLVGSQSDSVILILVYTGIISVSGYALSSMLANDVSRKEDAIWLWRTVLTGSFILTIVSAFGVNGTPEMVVYITIILALFGISVWSDRNTTWGKNIGITILTGYTTLAILMMNYHTGNSSLFLFIFSFIPFMMATVWYILAVGVTAIASTVLFIPIALGLLLLGVFGIHSIGFILIPVLLFYGVSSFFIIGVVPVLLQYFFFGIVGVFLIICSTVLSSEELLVSGTERLILTLTTFAFFIFSLYSAIRMKLDHLVLLTLILSVVLMSTLLSPAWWLSIAFFVVYLCIAFLVPFFTRKYTDGLPSISIILYQAILHIFMIAKIAHLGKDVWFSDTSTSLVTLGLVYFAISIFSTLYSFILTKNSIGFSDNWQEMSETERSLIYGIFAIPISIFSLSVAVIFSDNPSIVSSVWIIESSIFAYMYGRSRHIMILAGSIILMLIGLIRLIPFFDSVNTWEWLALVPVAIIAVSLFIGVRSIGNRLHPIENAYDIGHIFGIVAVLGAITQIVPQSGTGWSLLGISLFLLITIYSYHTIQSIILPIWLGVTFIGYFTYHMGRIDGLDITTWPLLIQLLALSIVYFASWQFSKWQHIWKYIFVLATIFVVIITSLYVNKITNNVFAVTIYLTIISASCIFRGIIQTKPYLRTIGLYIGIFVLVKILFYDLWVGVDGLPVRVLALMVTGGVMIWLSQIYGNAVTRSWSEEFSWNNFHFPVLDTPTMDTSTASQDDSIPFSEDITATLQQIDVSNLEAIQYIDRDGLIVFTSKRVGIMKLSRYITNRMKKSVFEPNELNSIYQSLLPKIQSNLPKKDLTETLASIEKWIHTGGKVEFVEKK